MNGQESGVSLNFFILEGVINGAKKANDTSSWVIEQRKQMRMGMGAGRWEEEEDSADKCWGRNDEVNAEDVGDGSDKGEWWHRSTITYNTTTIPA
eukprot:scaffold8835_cov70-Cyclotella_meneghiniana.AAC.6